jgi:dihydroxyacetone kinase
MNALMPLVAALSTATTFDDSLNMCKENGEGMAKLMVKLAWATYVSDTGNLPPDLGAMCLV